MDQLKHLTGAMKAMLPWDEVEEVAVSPVVGCDKGPEGDDDGIDGSMRPEAVGFGAHGFAEHEPFGKIFKAFGGFGKVPLQISFGTTTELCDMAVGSSPRGVCDG